MFLSEASTAKKSKISEPAIKLDPRCLSCQVTGHDISHITTLFKSACILYTPSNVTYNFKNFRRQDFLKMRERHFKESFGIKSALKL